MKLKKSHLRYSKSQRNGFFLWILIVVILQGILFFVKDSNKEDYNIDITSQKIQSELDSLFLLDKKEGFKIYPFNPNYLSDYKAYQLGMSVDEIDRLMIFRSSNQYVNSAKDFQKVTKVSDSLLKVISPYFKFPDWVTKKKSIVKKGKAEKIIVKDINRATTEELTRIIGIGEKRAQSIIKYRNLLGGYTYNNQLKEVWGIPPDVLERLQKEFKVLSKPNIKKININKATAYELSKVIYIDYELAKTIIEYRNEVAEIQNLAELKIIRDFPKDKFNLISLYLQAY